MNDSINTRTAYDLWANTYDSVENKTRDLELLAARDVLKSSDFSRVLEIGCGTGKNTVWLKDRAGSVTAVDFSSGMLLMAKQKINEGHVVFMQADITEPWTFPKVTLIICSLVLEHIEDTGFIFEQAAKTLDPGGCFYICELHPYKQLEGSRAKFQHGNEQVRLEYFIHHVSDFFMAAKENGFSCISLQEWFDEDNKASTPRLVSFLFRKKAGSF